MYLDISVEIIVILQFEYKYTNYSLLPAHFKQECAGKLCYSNLHFDNQQDNA